jgi:hypothetical protein
MQLRYISIPLLIAEAGGDPWKINQSLQAGRPAQISDLAEAFHTAGRCTTESNNAFEEARRASRHPGTERIAASTPSTTPQKYSR